MTATDYRVASYKGQVLRVGKPVFGCAWRWCPWNVYISCRPPASSMPGPGPHYGLISALELFCSLSHYTVRQGSANFHKGLDSKYFRLWVCLAMIQLCLCGRRATADDRKMKEHGCVPRKWPMDSEMWISSNLHVSGHIILFFLLQPFLELTDCTKQARLPSLLCAVNKNTLFYEIKCPRVLMQCLATGSVVFKSQDCGLLALYPQVLARGLV